jgi:hypothetical protein
MRVIAVKPLMGEGQFRRTREALSLYLVPIIGSAVLIPAWVVYVFAGSQAAYLAAVAAACLVAGWLAWRRDPAVLVFLVGVLALLGPEARGSLASGSAPLGDARILDLSLVAAALAGLLSAVRSSNEVTVGALAAGVRRCSLVLGHRYSLAIVALLMAWVVAQWMREGHPVDSVTRTDLRLAVIGTLLVVLLAALKPARPRALATGIVAVAALAAAKALAIKVSGLWVIGADDRLQASLRGEPSGVILAGGDTLLALAPAAAVVAAGPKPTRPRALALAFGALCAISGLLLSGTRTSFLTATVLLGLAVAWRLVPGVLSARRAAIACGLILLAMGAGGYIGGVLDRLPTEDAPHVGVNFRIDEARTILSAPTKDLVLGQGLGGRFVGKDVHGQPVTTGWAHVFPVWMLLKGGIVVVLGALVLGALFACTLARRIRQPATMEAAAMGALFVLGVLLLSLTLGRAALVEGLLFVLLGTSLVGLAGLARTTARA